MGDTFPIEVFATGRWANRDWTEADLDAMVANHGRLREYVKPPLKLGHDAKQILAQKDGQPALGWVERLERAGTKLIAHVVNVPRFLREAMQAGKGYRRVSSELYPTWQGTSWEKTLKTGVTGPVLSAIGLLGADPPEVKNLADLEALLATEGIAPVTLSEDGPAAGAEWIEAAIGNATTTIEVRVAPEFQATIDAAIAQMTALADRAEAAAARHPRTGDLTATGGGAMDEKDKQALMAEMAESLKAQTAAQIKEATKSLSETVTKLSEEKSGLEAKVTKLSEENAAMREREAVLRGERIADRALRFVEERTKAGNLRLFKSQAPAARLLHERLGDDVIVTTVEAKAAGLKREADYTARDLFVELVDGYPNARILQTDLLHAVPNGGRDEDAGSALERVAAAHKLNLTEAKQRDRAMALLAQEKPDLVPDYKNPLAAA